MSSHGISLGKHFRKNWSITLTNCLVIVCDPSPFFLRATGGDGFAGDTNPTPRYPPHYSATNVSVSSVVRTITIGLSSMEPRYRHRTSGHFSSLQQSWISRLFFARVWGRGNGDLFKPVGWFSFLNLNFNIRLRDLNIRFSHHNKKLQANFSTHYSSKQWLIGKWRHLLEASCKLIGWVTALAQTAPTAVVNAPAAAVPSAA